MDKTQIVNKFIEEGFLLSPKLLDQMTEETLRSILPSLKTKNTLILKEVEEQEISFSVKPTEQKKTMLVKDFTDYYNKKYTLIKDILSAKLTPNSINKIPFGKATIIASVLQKTASGFVLEDPTGRVEARMAETENKGLQPPQPIKTNSVLGFTGELKEKIFFIHTITFPDVPLDKKIKETGLTLSFRLENNKPKILVNNKKAITDLHPPTTVSVKKDIPISILVYRTEKQFTKTQAIDCLKLRFLPETKIPNESCIIAEEPDVFWIIQKEVWTENYKGVRIISGENAEVDLKRKS